ncbi:RNA-directed DNA polymerase from mobile element jockey [Stylophora pistillata]|uniref:RNA-directed DNA polymerase from mobile element jockey n=1 Tax=Stylophora pistillata TaxID=50429 RepID=A0A2B4RYD5_STYPI|nr:RNA-directed DNA polymerase from mobile element jockey [Stylophora pistillata]
MYLENVDVPRLPDTVETCAEKVSLFENIVKTGLDFIIPLRSKTIYRSEPPWLNDKLKNLIKRRQRALAKGNMDPFRTLRNCVNRGRNICRAKYYEAKVSHLRECKPSVWWKEVKKLSSMSPASETRDDTSKLLQHLGFSPGDLANYINSAFLTPMQSFEPLTHNPFDPPQINNERHAVNTISEFSTFMKLSALNPSKPQGPDGIPLRPISLTPILSKLAEDRIVEKYVKPAVLQSIDPRQFGSIPKSSASQALVNMTHNWLVNTEGNGATARVVLLDFSKAFDLIDHSVLVQKLATYDIPSQTKSWIVDFLMDRKQRVKLAQDCHSEWRSVPSGVPQETKLGPWLFLIMINDLDTPADLWKYVDNTSCSEIVTKGSENKLQEAVDDLSRQASIDGFQPNEAKCKELRIGFSSSNHDFEPQVLNGKTLELVISAKLLGVATSHDLRWNMHTSELSRKCSSRLYFLRQLKRSGVAPSEPVQFYVTCQASLGIRKSCIPPFSTKLHQRRFQTDPKKGTQNHLS